MVAEINTTRKANESLGGVFEVRAFGVVPGLGSHVSWEERLDGRLGAGDHVDSGDEGRGHRRRLRPGGPRGVAGPRRDLLVRGAGLLPRDQPRRRRGGRHDHRRPADRAGRHEAAAHAHQAAALGGHRHQGARAGAAGAHRLLHRARGRGGGRGDGGAGAGVGLPRQVRRRPHRRRSRRALAPTRSGSGGGADSGGPGSAGLAAGGAIVLVGFMGAGKSTAARAMAAELGVQPLDSDRELERRLGEPIESFFDREGEAAFRAREEEVVLGLLGRGPAARVVALGGGVGAIRARARRAARLTRSCSSRCDSEDAWRRASGKRTPAGPRPGPLRAAPAATASRSTSRWPTR